MTWVLKSSFFVFRRILVTADVLLYMIRTLCLWMLAITFGCSDPQTDCAIYRDEGDAMVQLTPEFTDSLRHLLKQNGNPASPPNPNEPPLSIAPAGSIELDGKTYDFYPGHIRRDETIWQNEATIEFFRAMYPLDGTPSVAPEDFRPSS